jgi:hypothetical protein
VRRIAILLLCLCGCVRAPVNQEPCRDLLGYAHRHGIPDSEIEAQGDAWPQYVYDYSISHGPNLNEDEMADYRSWKGE